MFTPFRLIFVFLVCSESNISTQFGKGSQSLPTQIITSLLSISPPFGKMNFSLFHELFSVIKQIGCTCKRNKLITNIRKFVPYISIMHHTLTTRDQSSLLKPPKYRKFCGFLIFSGDIKKQHQAAGFSTGVLKNRKILQNLVRGRS